VREDGKCIARGYQGCCQRKALKGTGHSELIAVRGNLNKKKSKVKELLQKKNETSIVGKKKRNGS